MRAWVFTVGALFWLLSGTAILPARPFIFHRGILNAASYVPAGLPNGAIARGSIFTIFGRDLGPIEAASVTAFPLESTLQGVSVEVCQGRCLAAIPLFVRADQVNAIMPSDAPLGPVSVRVNFDGEAGNFSPAQVVDASLGIFTVSSSGFGPAVLQNFVATDNQPINSAETAARPGQAVTLWATGLGAALNADNQAPQVGNLPVPIEIFVGDRPVTNVLYFGRSPCCSGVDQIVFHIPDDAPAGCFVPVHVRTGGSIVSNSATVAITSDGDPCFDPANPWSDFRAGGRTGLVLLSRVQTSHDLLPAIEVDFTSDMMAGLFQDEPPGPWHFSRLTSLPPAGACATYAGPGGGLRVGVLAGLAASGRSLSAGGELGLEGSGGAKSAPTLSHAAGFYGTFAGATLELFQDIAALFFGAGTQRVSGTGGADVGPFAVEMPSPTGLDWTNRSVLEEIERGAPLEAVWTGGDPEGLVLLWGLATDHRGQASAGFVCAEKASTNRLSVPGWATAGLPLPDRARGVQAILTLVSLPPRGTRFTATGLDVGLGLFVSAQARAVAVH